MDESRCVSFISQWEMFMKKKKRNAFEKSECPFFKKKNVPEKLERGLDQYHLDSHFLQELSKRSKCRYVYFRN
jgi:hypothetical protein